MSTIYDSELRIATAILAASFSLLAAPVLASAEIDSAEESGRQDRIEHPYLGDIDPPQAAYIEAMDAKLGPWQ
ncbi:hypothetical protein IQ265_24185 [Nodosilinea sp. LEGE 06152]|uniref:hypothetical protein n=1 Tax=Nodosilinea sp. LEGE 06152 TaxID=2777966 RepID=UPI0018801BF2|nr:hypothetical protein [Nodosilinea sp. LEGE 06152]MBE9159906.1 hypothetical protein [Nodosilinea sp. LEGE 06152]